MSLCGQCEQTVEQTLYWPVIRDAMAAIWRRRNAQMPGDEGSLGPVSI